MKFLKHVKLTEDGEIGVNGASAPFLVEVAKILDIVLAIILFQSMVVPTALEMPAKWEHAMKILAQVSKFMLFLTANWYNKQLRFLVWFFFLQIFKVSCKYIFN